MTRVKWHNAEITISCKQIIPMWFYSNGIVLYERTEGNNGSLGYIYNASKLPVHLATFGNSYCRALGMNGV